MKEQREQEDNFYNSCLSVKDSGCDTRHLLFIDTHRVKATWFSMSMYYLRKQEGEGK